MNKTPIAEELLRSFFHYETDESFSKLFKEVDKNQVLAFGREFAKLHVQNCKEEITEKVLLNEFAEEFLQEGASEAIDKHSILSSYPLDKII